MEAEAMDAVGNNPNQTPGEPIGSSIPMVSNLFLSIIITNITQPVTQPQTLLKIRFRASTSSQISFPFLKRMATWLW